MIECIHFINTPSEEFETEDRTYTYHHSDVCASSFQRANYYNIELNQDEVCYYCTVISEQGDISNLLTPTNKFSNGLVHESWEA